MLPFDSVLMERGVRGLFGREFLTKTKEAKYPRMCSVVNSDKREEKFVAISTLPQLEELLDERKLAGFSEYEHTITNKPYATGIRVPRRLFEFEQTGQLKTLVQSLGARVANFPDKLVFTMIGANPTCYDKAPFFSTTHDLGNGVNQSNVITGNLSNALLAGAVSGGKADRDNAIAAFQMDLMQAIARLLRFKDDRGEPWHDSAEPTGLAILCHPDLTYIARTALEGSLVDATSNMMAKSVGQIIQTNYDAPFTNPAAATPDLVKAGAWSLFKLDTPIRPFIFQRFGPKTNFEDSIPEADQEMYKALAAVEIQSVMRTGQNISEFTFFNDEFLFGARVVYSAGVAMWQNAVRVIPSDWAA